MVGYDQTHTTTSVFYNVFGVFNSSMGEVTKLWHMAFFVLTHYMPAGLLT